MGSDADFQDDIVPFACLADCGPFACSAETDIVFGVPPPAVELGTWTLQAAPGDDWTNDTFTWIADGTFWGYGEYDGSAYIYYGSTVQSVCEMSDGLLYVMYQYWFHQVGLNEPGKASVICRYGVWEDSAQGPILVSSASFTDGNQHSEASLMVGELPGMCPEPVDDQLVAPEWMSDATFQDDLPSFACSADCGPFACSMDVGSCSHPGVISRENFDLAKSMGYEPRECSRRA